MMESNNIKNIVLIVVDALRAKNLGCYGYPVNTSPNIDRFADKSVVFEDAYACCANTDPAFTSIATGLYPPNHGIINHANRIKPEETKKIANIPFLAEILKEQGFKTYGLDFLSRWHKRGFDYYMGIEDSPKSIRVKIIDSIRDILRIQPGSKIQNILEKTPLYNFFLKMLFSRGSTPYWPANKLVDMALEILTNNPDQRRFLFLHFWDTHKPYWPPDKYTKVLSESDYSKLYPYAEKPLSEIEETICSPLSRFFFKQMSYGKFRASDLIRAYDGEIRFTDDNVGRLLSDINEDSLVILMADHGESLTEHDIFFTHEGLYSQALHIPFILHYPGCTGKRVRGFVQPVDILPSIVDFLQIPIEMEFDGSSVLSLIRGDKPIRKKSFAINCSPLRKEASVFDQEYKYISALSHKDNICEYCGRPHRAYEEFYNLLEDPQESNNLAESKSEEMLKFKRKFEEFICPIKISARRKETQWTDEEDNEVKKRLQSLGYF